MSAYCLFVVVGEILCFLLLSNTHQPYNNLELCVNYDDHRHNGSSCLTREGALDANGTECRQSSWQASQNTETGESNHSRSQSFTLGQKNHPKLTNPAQDLLRRACSVTFGRQGGKSPALALPDNVGRPSAPHNMSDAEGASNVSSASSDECDTLSRSTSRGSLLSTYSSSGMVNVGLVSFDRTEGSEIGSELLTLPQRKEDPIHSTPPSVLV